MPGALRGKGRSKGAAFGLVEANCTAVKASTIPRRGGSVRLAAYGVKSFLMRQGFSVGLLPPPPLDLWATVVALRATNELVHFSLPLPR
jgi:hypothetical protein